MKTNYKSALAVRKRWKCKAWTLCGAALLSFAAGSLLTARLIHASQVRADSNRVFELMIYHAVPGKGPELESIFRDVSKLQAKYDLNVVGYWVPNDDSRLEGHLHLPRGSSQPGRSQKELARASC